MLEQTRGIWVTISGSPSANSPRHGFDAYQISRRCINETHQTKLFSQQIDKQYHVRIPTNKKSKKSSIKLNQSKCKQYHI